MIHHQHVLVIAVAVFVAVYALVFAPILLAYLMGGRK